MIEEREVLRCAQDDSSHGEPHAPAVLRQRRPFLLAVVVAAVTFCAIAPTLSWLEFSSGSENLNVVTVLEMRRGGPWLIPTLQGKPRTQKPPLTAWLTAAAVRPGTMAGLDDADPVRRDAAYTRLAWDTRWTALGAACAMLLAVYGLGRAIGDARLGLLAAAVCASTVMFLRQARFATTDVHLALWVTVTNCLLAAAVLRHWRLGYVLAGAALGLAFMSKGPVALVQTVLPFVLFISWRRWCPRHEARDEGSTIGRVIPSPPRPLTPSLLLATLAFLAIGLPWYALVISRAPDVGGLWFKEVSRVGANEMQPGPWYSYFSFLPLMLPWLAFFLSGLFGAVHDLLKRRGGRTIVLALMLVVVPVLVMSLVKDRKERYLLPMVGPAAVLTAWGLREAYRHCPRLDAAGRWLTAIHWSVLAVLLIGVPIAGAVGPSWLRTVDDHPWYGWPCATACAAGGAAVVVVAALVVRHQRLVALAAGTLVAMLGLHAVLLRGYRDSPEGRSELKPLAYEIRAARPDALTFYNYNRRAPSDLSIYLNRVAPRGDFAAAAEAARGRGGGVAPVVFMFHKAGRPPPVPPPGWVEVGRSPRDDDGLFAFAPGPPSGTSQTGP